MVMNLMVLSRGLLDGVSGAGFGVVFSMAFSRLNQVGSDFSGELNGAINCQDDCCIGDARHDHRECHDEHPHLGHQFSSLIFGHLSSLKGYGVVDSWSSWNKKSHVITRRYAQLSMA
jgi:hypothetical protein